MGKITSQVKEAFFKGQKIYLLPSLTAPRNFSSQFLYHMKLDALNVLYKVFTIALGPQLSKLMEVTSGLKTFLSIWTSCSLRGKKLKKKDRRQIFKTMRNRQLIEQYPMMNRREASLAFHLPGSRTSLRHYKWLHCLTSSVAWRLLLAGPKLCAFKQFQLKHQYSPQEFKEDLDLSWLWEESRCAMQYKNTISLMPLAQSNTKWDKPGINVQGFIKGNSCFGQTVN